ncbi:ABC transporter ATP-binding protein [Psychromonas sp. Urea-02u-13]|uniref:ABC transporter ATP-binding protein n=1 Tax=Psychromonas sp. Urea-02u-13 TaxID=2058326 RepID=UPI000C345FDE|nr:ABC transporter ATP-binding protein [Psychromonas sp. Urea-02u-13]PKG39109.1 ABC transporter ATP-binding protein [Psychromonas sp. Urea-02u-13]
MHNVKLLVNHSGAKTGQFWMGLFGKIATESMPLIIWLMLFSYILSLSVLPFTYMALLALAVIIAQFVLGKSARNSFLGAYKITHQLRSQLLTDIRRQPLATLRGKGLGEKMKLITTDLKQFEDIFSHIMVEFVGAWVIPIAMLITLLFIKPMIALFMLAIFLFALGILVMSERAFSLKADHYHHANIDSSNQLLEYIDCLPMLRGFAQSQKLAMPLCAQIEQQKHEGLGLEWAGGMGVLAATLVFEFSLLLNIALAVWFIDQGELSFAQFLVVTVATIACIRPLARMTVYATLLRYMLKAAGRLEHLSQLSQQQEEGVEPHSFDVCLSGVNLALGGNSILREINLNVAEGEHIALVGTSGAGKSTLLDLIAAFHIPNSGRISIGQQSIEEIGTRHWYGHLSYVTQNVQLLGGSLRDNLLLAKPDADKKTLFDVIEAAGLTALITRLPEGIDTFIGENGNQLSGGERQRLSIARALLHDAPVLLLDEITSALDVNTQAQVLSAINKLAKGKTVISVAHRLETIKNVDRIYLMEKGRIIASGTHDELMGREFDYRELWQAGEVG